MQWPRIHDTFLEIADALPELVAAVPDFSVPALGEWDAAQLTGHLYRAIATPVRALADPEPEGSPLEDASAYLIAYLERRETDPEAITAGITERATEELAGVDPAAYPRRFREAAAAARAALQLVPWERKVPTPMGPMRIADYLRTRTFEAVVHSLDLTRATGVDWSPPDDAVADSLVLLTEVARHRGHGPDLLLALTGRPDVPPGTIPIFA